MISGSAAPSHASRLVHSGRPLILPRCSYPPPSALHSADPAPLRPPGCSAFQSAQDSDLAHRRPGHAEITCSDASAFKSWSQEELRQVVGVLQGAHAQVEAGTMTQVKFQDLQQGLGLHHNPHGLLASQVLAPHVDLIQATTYDWVHNMLQEGVFNVEISAFLTAARIPRADVQAFLADPTWRFPKWRNVKSRSLHSIFGEKRVSATNPTKVRASCSEMLGVYGLMRNFVEIHIPERPGILPHRRSFHAACEIIDFVLAAKRKLADVQEVAQKLERVTVRHMELHTAAYGTALIKPKHHWQLDVPRQIERDGLVLDAFVIERTHLAVKAVADHVRNTSQYEASVLASLCTTVWRAKAELCGGGRLLGQVAPLPGCPDALVADRMEAMSIVITVGDVVLRGGSVGVVAGCCLSDGRLVALTQPAAVLRQVSDHSVGVNMSSTIEAWPVVEVRHCLAWREQADGSLLVVRE